MESFSFSFKSCHGKQNDWVLTRLHWRSFSPRCVSFLDKGREDRLHWLPSRTRGDGDRLCSAVETRVSARVKERQLRLICPSSVAHAAGLYRGAVYYSFCEAKASALFLLIPNYHPVRHRFTVAGNRFDYFCHFVFVLLFQQQTVTWRVPENQLCTILEYDKKKKKMIQSIVLISGAPKGLLTKDSNAFSCLPMSFGLYFGFLGFFWLGTKSIFDCMDN